jgi:L-threonylcarbamoyladenylate synthase
MATIGTDIQKAKELLRKGDLVAIPTETVYGLAADATNAMAAAKIFAAKDRPEFDPLIVHVPDLETAQKYVSEIPAKAVTLANLFWPGPLTLILKKNMIIPDIVTSGMDTVGIRCPDHGLTRQLLKELPFPLAAPSANPFGYVSPTRAEHVDEQLGNKIEYILDGGPCRVGIESTIVGFENQKPVIYRLGGLSLEKIEHTIGKFDLQPYSTSNPKAPGQLKSHYAPGHKLILGNIDELLPAYPSKRLGILSFKNVYGLPHEIVLSPSGSLDEAAKNLFAALRQFDTFAIDMIIAELVPDEGLGRAINDRLRRAAAAS